jgi:hypothetical protein
VIRPFWKRRLRSLVLAVSIAIVFGTVLLISGGLWSKADGAIRPVLELLPGELVAETTADPGQPFIVGGVATALVVVGAVFLGRWLLRLIRRYLASDLTYPALFGAAALAAVAVVGGLGLAWLMGSIADGEDLHHGPHDEFPLAAWHVLAFIGGLLALTYLGLSWALGRERVRPLPIGGPN